MMTDYTILQGEQDWRKKHNDFVTANEYKCTAWTSDGLTYLNGFSASGNGVEYRTIDIGDTHTVEVCGWMNTPDLTNGQVINAFTVPKTILKTTAAVIFNNIAWYGDRWAKVDLDAATGNGSLTDMDPAGTPASLIAVNLRFSW